MKKICEFERNFYRNCKPQGAKSAHLADFERFQQLLEKIFLSEFSVSEVCAEAGVCRTTLDKAKKRKRAPRKTTMRRLRHGLQRLEREVL